MGLAAGRDDPIFSVCRMCFFGAIFFFTASMREFCQFRHSDRIVVARVGVILQANGFSGRVPGGKIGISVRY